MHKVITSQLVPDMVVARDVYTPDNQLIISEKFVLTDRAIMKLEYHSIPYIWITDMYADKEVAAEDVPQAVPTYSDRIRQSPEFQKFAEEFETGVQNFKSALNDIAEGNAVPDVDAMLEETLSLLENSRGSIHIFDMLHNLRNYDDTTYAHAINVALISNIIATWLNMSPEDINLATQCGLLHDIGKLKIPQEIIKKPSALTDEEYEIIKKHTTEGYQILKKFDLDPHILKAALLHHERCDGSGYPLKLQGAKIDKFAKIVAIADVYDAMTSARIYRGAICPFKVIEVFESEGLQKYDAQLMMTFLRNILNTYISNHVRLSDGRECEVLMINSQCLSRPLLRCGNTYIDLSQEPASLTIEAVL